MKIQVGKGMDEYLAKLGNLEINAPEMCEKAVFDGAKIVADQIKANIKEIPVQDKFEEYATGIKTIQKEGLIRSFGIAKCRNDNGYINVKAGFDGYNALKAKKYPSGQPNAMIARTVEAGNSHTKKHPFVAPAVRATKEKAEMAMQMTIDQEINKIMN